MSNVQATSRRLGRLGALLLCTAALLGGCGTSKPAIPPAAGKTDPGSVLMGRANLGKTPAPDFTLTNQFGQKVSLSDFRGKAVLIAFTDSECTTICPLTTSSMVDAQRMLGPAAKDVQLIGIDANPDAISVQDVYKYSQAHGLLHGWQFLTGSLDQLKAMWKSYHIDVQIIKGNIDHTPALFLIDPQGNERYLYLTSGRYAVVGAESKVIAYDLAHVLPPGTAKAPSLPQSIPSLGSATQQFTLPALLPGGQSVTVGPGDQRVVVFIASWFPQIGQALTSLEAYQSWAKQHNAPQLLAVDEMPTEPSLATAQGALQGLNLSFPIVQDKDGKLADAYRVQDIAWTAFLSKDGKIIDNHDGFVTAQQLITQVEKDYSIKP